MSFFEVTQKSYFDTRVVHFNENKMDRREDRVWKRSKWRNLRTALTWSRIESLEVIKTDGPPARVFQPDSILTFDSIDTNFSSFFQFSMFDICQLSQLTDTDQINDGSVLSWIDSQTIDSGFTEFHRFVGKSVTL